MCFWKNVFGNPNVHRFIGMRYGTNVLTSGRMHGMIQTEARAFIL